MKKLITITILATGIILLAGAESPALNLAAIAVAGISGITIAYRWLVSDML